MSIKRFLGKTTSEALRMVRDALGPEGVILSNRTTAEGVEIFAVSNSDMATLVPQSNPEEAASAPRVPLGQDAAERGYQMRALLSSSKENVRKSAEAVTDVKNLSRPDSFISSGKQGREVENAIPDGGAISALATEQPQTTAPTVKVMRDSARLKARPSIKSSGDAQPTAGNNAAPGISSSIKRRRGDSAASGKIAPNAGAHRKKGPSVIDPLQGAGEVAASVLREIRSMRGALEQQLAALKRGDPERNGPVRGRMLRQLLAAGFSDSLTHDLLDQLHIENDGSDARDGNSEEGLMNRVKKVLTSNLHTIANEGEILEKGGVYALVGPTGVGKTTTTAKLAARCVVRHGAHKLALLTTDGYRIGGHEQLRIYGKILGVTVHAVRDTQDLSLALAELRGKHTVLIDTVGMGQRDQMVAEQVAMLAGCGTPVKRLLLLNAASNRHTLNEVAHAYRGDGLAGAIITKLDEAVTMGCALDTAIRHRLPLYYVARGQRVPEDLEMADPGSLVDSALDNSPTDSPFAMAEEAFPLIMTGRNSGAGNLDMSEVRLG